MMNMFVDLVSSELPNLLQWILVYGYITAKLSRKMFELQA